MVLKARIKHDDSNPTIRMIERSSELQAKWDATRKAKVDSNFAEGTLVQIPAEQAAQMRQLKTMWVFYTRRNATQKARVTVNGSPEGPEGFQPKSTFAPTLPVAGLLWLIAYATYHRMRIRGIDFERAFLRHNGPPVVPEQA